MSRMSSMAHANCASDFGGMHQHCFNHGSRSFFLAYDEPSPGSRHPRPRTPPSDPRASATTTAHIPPGDRRRRSPPAELPPPHPEPSPAGSRRSDSRSHWSCRSSYGPVLKKTKCRTTRVHAVRQLRITSGYRSLSTLSSNASSIASVIFAINSGDTDTPTTPALCAGCAVSTCREKRMDHLETSIYCCFDE